MFPEILQRRVSTTFKPHSTPGAEAERNLRSGGTPASPWLGKPLPHFQEGFQPPDMGHGHMSACPPHPPDMAAHKQNRGTSGSLFQPGEVSGSDFLFHPLMLPRDPGSQSKATMVSFSISPHPSKAPETWRVSLGGRRNHPRRLPSPLPCQKELRGQGRDCKPEGPTGHRGPHRARGGQTQGQWFPARVQPARTACAPAPPANPNPWGKGPSPSINLPVTHPEDFTTQPRLRVGTWPQRPPAVTGLQTSKIWK